jgi:hypothetical protein
VTFATPLIQTLLVPWAIIAWQLRGGVGRVERVPTIRFWRGLTGSASTRSRRLPPLSAILAMLAAFFAIVAAAGPQQRDVLAVTVVIDTRPPMTPQRTAEARDRLATLLDRLDHAVIVDEVETDDPARLAAERWLADDPLTVLTDDPNLPAAAVRVPPMSPWQNVVVVDAVTDGRSTLLRLTVEGEAADVDIDGTRFLLTAGDHVLTLPTDDVFRVDGHLITPRLAALPPLRLGLDDPPESLIRFVAAWNASLPAKLGEPVVLSQTGEVVISPATRAASMPLTIRPFEPVTAVDWQELTDLQVTQERSPPGFDVMLRDADGRPLLAIEPEPCRIWIGFESAMLAREPSYLRFWSDLIHWLRPPAELSPEPPPRLQDLSFDPVASRDRLEAQRQHRSFARWWALLALVCSMAALGWLLRPAAAAAYD